MRYRLGALVAVLTGGTISPAARAQTTGDAPVTGNPAAIVDLRTEDGARLVQGRWRFREAKIIAVDGRAPGADLRPSGAANRTFDITPRVGTPEFEADGWTPILAPAVEDRRGTGRLSFAWYRLDVTIPARVGTLDPTGMTAVFEVVLDDYAEVWVNGRLPVVLGQTGGQLVKGFNAPNRVVLTRDARPGQRFQLAVFGANGPLSNPPANFIWIRSATLDFYRADAAAVARDAGGRIERLDPALEEIVPASARVEKLAGGFQFLEGPVWVRDGGYLLFSDPNANTIYRWTPDGEVSVFRAKSGYSGVNVSAYHQPGSNGLALDRDGRLTIDQHGDRRVVRIERTGAVTVLADRYQGRRLNSPNDLVYRSDGSLYFTDPPFGLPKVFDDPAKETVFSGVYLLREGKLTLLTKELTGPNGLAFSPDERTFYVDNWDPAHKVILAYDVRSDGTLEHGRVFFDITRSEPGDDAWDGIKVDQRGNVYAAGPRGIYVLSPAGRLLGVISPPEHVANFAWGDADNRALYITASTGLYRIRLSIPGAGAFVDAESALR